MNYFPITESMRATASGIIALEIARDRVTYILFFRRKWHRPLCGPETGEAGDRNRGGVPPASAAFFRSLEGRGQRQGVTVVEGRGARRQRLRKLIAVVAYAR